MTRPRALALGVAALTLVLTGAGLALVWGPLWWHFHVAVPPVDASVLQRHRQQPDDRVLAVVADASMMTDHPLQREAAVAAARHLLQGELVLPALPPLAIGRGFAAAQLEQGVPVQQVFIASLIVPDLLLRAHEHAPDPAFVAAAERYLRGFIAHEARVQFPEGLLANPHAVANRAAVLARFWRHARATADEALAREVHSFALRTGTLLARPSFFIAATNHGVMQNVALLQLAAAFPTLPQADAWRRTALQRLEQQRPVYIAADGAVLEHAAGYHFHGVVVSGYVLRLLREAGQPVPPAWQQAHDDARALLAAMQRPDRSLPAIGNTYRYAWRLPALVQPDDAAWAGSLRGRSSFVRTLPLSGHAIWWDAGAPGDEDNGVQTVVPWGWFMGHGHLRAQEMSLLIWAAGTDWSTNSGYWPNSDGAGFELANGFAGSNAPHTLGEKAVSARRTTLLAHAEQGGLRLLDLQRLVPESGLRVRRQIVQWQARQWLVLDSVEDPHNGELRVLWTAAPETVQTARGERVFTLARPGLPLRFSVAVDGGAGVSATPLRGSRAPFGGWVAFDRKAAPAPAVDARVPAAGGWMLATLQLAAADTPPLRAGVLRHGGAEDWALQLPLPDRPVTLTRRGAQLEVSVAGEAPTTVALTPGPSVSQELAAIQTAGDALRREYPRFRTAEAERRERSLLIVGGGLMAGLTAWFLARRRPVPAAAPL